MADDPDDVVPEPSPSPPSDGDSAGAASQGEPPDHPPTGEEILEHARRAQDEGQLDVALHLATALLFLPQCESVRWEAALLGANIALDCQRPADAGDWVAKLRALAPDSAETLYAEGRLLEAQGRDRQAFDRYLDTLSAGLLPPDGDLHEIHVRMIQCAVRLRDSELGARAREFACAARVDTPRAKFLLAVIADSLGEHEAAVGVFEELIEQPQSERPGVETYLLATNLARCAEAQNRPMAADRYFAIALDSCSDPASVAQIHLAHCRLLAKRGQLEAAQRAVEAAAAAAPHHPDVAEHLAQLLRATGGPGSGVGLMEQLAGTYDNRWYRRWLAEMYLGEDQPAKAVKLFEQLAAEEPGPTPVSLWLAAACAARGEPGDMEQALRLHADWWRHYVLERDKRRGAVTADGILRVFDNYTVLLLNDDQVEEAATVLEQVPALGWDADQLARFESRRREIDSRRELATLKAATHLSNDGWGGGETSALPPNSQGPCAPSPESVALLVDLSTRDARVFGHRLDLHRGPFDLLAAIARTPGTTVRHENMRDLLSPLDMAGHDDLGRDDDPARNASRLRQALTRVIAEQPSLESRLRDRLVAAMGGKMTVLLPPEGPSVQPLLKRLVMTRRGVGTLLNLAPADCVVLSG